ncbi:hypothetical protein [Salisediminibacterium selenitireducens]|uniref:Uncharacterized protein n=1 Tax=Bacillus selenitireducens (strain ATCC 700615 / DSM 15326 / MLS10) TaxID=439292 RepID=D6XW02_BACIE|nr:hypothetical protein [Salisediminibacterium selenitireducens]ADH97775.1 hypothetical protein Bsel_0230 [[Bacillus] selenitireducens MLS10]
MKEGAYLFYFFSVVSAGFGFYKYWHYDNSEGYAATPVNAYVGGDAYNYIINANYMIAFFVLALIFVVIANHLFKMAVLTEKQTSNNQVAKRQLMQKRMRRVNRV